MSRYTKGKRWGGDMSLEAEIEWSEGEVARIERRLLAQQRHLIELRARLRTRECRAGRHAWGDWVTVAREGEGSGEGVLVHCVRQCLGAECQATETRSFPF